MQQERAKGEHKRQMKNIEEKNPIMVGVQWHQNEERDAKVRNNENYDL